MSLEVYQPRLTKNERDVMQMYVVDPKQRRPSCKLLLIQLV